MSSPAKYNKRISVFGGYNHSLITDDGEFYDMKNMTSSYYPVLATRHKRALFNEFGENLHCLFAKEKLLYVKGTKLYYGGSAVTGFPVLYEKYAEKRKIVSMGAYAVIFPDKVYLNTADLSDYGSLEAEFSTSEGITTSYSLCTLDGENYENYTVSPTVPENPANGDMWLDTSGKVHSLKIYSESASTWNAIATTYVKIATPAINEFFEQYDCITFSGSEDEQFNKDLIIWAKGDGYIVVNGIIDAAFTQTTPIFAERRVPDMDYICEGENRLWGCNSEKNEIYCCKLGDFKNWRCYMGLESDSYAVSVGSDGDFTGAIKYGTYILFFKENCIHKVYGVNPPYNISVSNTRGVQKGSEKSLAIVNEYLFYKSATGVCIYQGGSAISISDDFGPEYYSNAIGGNFRNKYYLSMQTGSKRELFVYDLVRRMWHKEDNLEVLEMANCNSNLYMLIQEENKRRVILTDGEQAYGVFSGNLSGFGNEADIEWFAETGVLGLEFDVQKGISRIIIRCALEGTMKVLIDYDSQNEWVELMNVSEQKLKGFSLPVTPNRRFDHFRLRFEGVGKLNLYSLTFNIEERGELN